MGISSLPLAQINEWREIDVIERSEDCRNVLEKTGEVDSEEFEKH